MYGASFHHVVFRSIYGFIVLVFLFPHGLVATSTLLVLGLQAGLRIALAARLPSNAPGSMVGGLGTHFSSGTLT